MNWLEYAVLFLVAGSVTIALVPAVNAWLFVSMPLIILVLDE